MENNNFDVNLSDMNEVFNNRTFKYRINGFAYACGMKNIKVLDDSRILFNTNESNKYSEMPSYFISTNVNTNSNGSNVTLSGQYNDLSFIFINYYGKEKLDKKIVEIPFSISLTKNVGDDTYYLNIETNEGINTKFTIHKYQEYKDRTLCDDIVFYANVMDFSKILKLVKSFVYNPKLVFSIYNEIDAKYHRVYTNGDLDKAVMQDVNLDKPMSKIQKVLKKIMG